MTLPVFDFPFYQVSVKYPNSSSVASLGGSWVYATAPVAPDQREFELYFPALVYYVDENDNIDPYKNKFINAYALELFYRSVRCFGMFTYNHPTEGPMTVRFKNPLAIPKGAPGGSGAVLGVTVTLLELPGVTG